MTPNEPPVPDLSELPRLIPDIPDGLDVRLAIVVLGPALLAELAGAPMMPESAGPDAWGGAQVQLNCTHGEAIEILQAIIRGLQHDVSRGRLN